MAMQHRNAYDKSNVCVDVIIKLRMLLLFQSAMTLLHKHNFLNEVIKIQCESSLFARTSRVDISTVVLAQWRLMLGQCARDPTGCSVEDIE